MVKSYLVEAHTGLESGPEELLRRLAPRIGFELEQTDEQAFFRMTYAPSEETWCDATMGRFWRLHTVSRVADADSFADRLVSASPWLDRVWLPSTYLEALPQKVGGVMQTFSLSHDRRKLMTGLGGGDWDYVSMRLWASDAARMLERVRRAELFPHGVSIRSVRMRAGSDEPGGDYCVDEFFHHGKVTASGTSFDEHSRLVVQVLRDYRAMVEGIEARFGLGYGVDGNEHRLAGEPIVIDLEWTLDDLEYAVARIFSSAEPFRLWGMPERVGESHLRARAVDLHIGATLTFDITREQIVVTLPKNVCGNSVVRFIGNLHYFVNSDVASELLH